MVIKVGCFCIGEKLDGCSGVASLSGVEVTGLGMKVKVCGNEKRILPKVGDG